MSDDVRRGIVRVCKRMYERGLIAGPDGNVSVRITYEHVLVTPQGFSKATVEENDLVLVTLDGKRVGGRHEPSSELGMHLAVYRVREDVNAVVHAHPRPVRRSCWRRWRPTCLTTMHSCWPTMARPRSAARWPKRTCAWRASNTAPISS
jgi:hypothetical protein